MKMPIAEMFNVSASTGEGRLLFEDLTMGISQDRVALIGRNGVGKSTFLEILGGGMAPGSGKVVLRCEPHLVRQLLDQSAEAGGPATTLEFLRDGTLPGDSLSAEFASAGLRPPEKVFGQETLSHGEFRKLRLLAAKLARPQLLLLDEPSQDLDEHGVCWLWEWVRNWPNGLIVATHDHRLLEVFKDFFIIAETGCRYFSGSFATLEESLTMEQRANQERYVRNLNRLIEREDHTIHIARRRGRKRQYGRVSELGRATPRARLNQKRDYAQVKHGKMKRTRDARISAIREWTKSTRRALKVDLPLVLPPPLLPTPDERPLICLREVSATVDGRCLFKGLDLDLRRERLAVTGPNGSGKTTLLEVMLGRRAPTSGSARADQARIGAVAQGGSDWMLEESLVSYLQFHSETRSGDALAGLLVSHRFPLALARRPLRSLSPGERVRAAMICLFQRASPAEMLVLDEPTYCLDLVGQRALRDALKAWPGGLVVASHDQSFLSRIGIDATVHLGASNHVKVAG